MGSNCSRGIVLQMTYIRNVTHIAHLIAQMFQITKHKIEGNGRASMPQMRITIDGGTADIHTDMRGVKGLEALLLTRQSIINNQF